MRNRYLRDVVVTAGVNMREVDDAEVSTAAEEAIVLEVDNKDDDLKVPLSIVEEADSFDDKGSDSNNDNDVRNDPPP